MKNGCVPKAVFTLLVSGMLLWSTTAQAFSFCFSFGSKGRGSTYSQSRYYQPYGAWLPPPMPVMPYSYVPYTDSYTYTHTYTDTYIHPVAPVSERDLVTEENQGLDYIMERAH